MLISEVNRGKVWLNRERRKAWEEFIRRKTSTDYDQKWSNLTIYSNAIDYRLKEHQEREFDEKEIEVKVTCWTHIDCFRKTSEE